MIRAISRLTFLAAALAFAAMVGLGAGSAWAQQDQQAPAEAAPGQPQSEEEIREQLSKDSIDRFTNHWKRRRGYLNNKECEDYQRLQGPTVYCNADEVPDEVIDEYRDAKDRASRTFITEGTPQF